MSGVLLVILSPLPIGMNSIVFVTCSSILGIGVVSVVFGSIPSMFCSGVPRSISVAGTFYCLVNFFSVFRSFLLQVLTLLTIKFLKILGLPV